MISGTPPKFTQKDERYLLTSFSYPEMGIKIQCKPEFANQVASTLEQLAINPMAMDLMKNAYNKGTLQKIDILSNWELEFMVKYSPINTPFTRTGSLEGDAMLLKFGSCYYPSEKCIFIMESSSMLVDFISELCNANNARIEEIDDLLHNVDNAEQYAKVLLDIELDSLTQARKVYQYGVEHCQYPLPMLLEFARSVFPESVVKKLLYYTPTFMKDLVGKGFVDYADRETYVKEFGSNHLVAFKEQFKRLGGVEKPKAITQETDDENDDENVSHKRARNDDDESGSKRDDNTPLKRRHT